MRYISLTAALVVCLWVAMAEQATAQASAVQPVARMYSDAQGETHIETVMMDVGRSNGFSGTETTYFSRFAADMDLDWHPAPRRQYVITLSGEVEIGLEDGTMYRYGPGHVNLAEDVTGHGHTTRVVGDVPRVTATVQLAD